MTDERILGELLRDREAELGITVTEAARRADLALRQYQKYRNEHVVPQAPALKRLSEGLGIRARELNAAVDQSVREVEEKAGKDFLRRLAAPATRGDLVEIE